MAQRRLTGALRRWGRRPPLFSHDHAWWSFPLALWSMGAASFIAHGVFGGRRVDILFIAGAVFEMVRAAYRRYVKHTPPEPRTEGRLPAWMCPALLVLVAIPLLAVGNPLHHRAQLLAGAALGIYGSLSLVATGLTALVRRHRSLRAAEPDPFSLR